MCWYLKKSIAVIPTKSTSLDFMKVTPFANIMAYPLLCVQSLYLYVIPTVCCFSEKQLNNILLFVINLGHEDLKVGKLYFILAFTKYESVQSKNTKASVEDIVYSISTEQGTERLPATAINY